MANEICLLNNQDGTTSDRSTNTDSLLKQLIETKMKLAKLEEEKYIMLKKFEISEKLKTVNKDKRKELDVLEIETETKKLVQTIVNKVEYLRNLDQPPESWQRELSAQIMQQFDKFSLRRQEQDDFFLQQSQETIKILRAKLNEFEKTISSLDHIVKEQADQLKNITMIKERQSNEEAEKLRMKLLDLTKKFIDAKRKLANIEEERQRNETRINIGKNVYHSLFTHWKP
ncbi:uncharacterized protein LOC106068957 isoform X3 [Biomphalaria glabrata]|uniref:Uncharacterized protein LOC106068957 isoform X3 n=1 Tax=Biomphalaria glabrata TaxID=6526 RepID=A0A9W3AGN4_BIOGL|nr:uncharacterized protein LOC106068957 isoform X3 [Biomphalaria glabrata]